MIGLFLGEKKLPLEILKSLKKKKFKYFIIDLSKNNKFKYDINSYSINIGKFGKILELIKSKKCRKVLFAGNIVKPRISKLKLDLKGIYYMPRIVKASKLGRSSGARSLTTATVSLVCPSRRTSRCLVTSTPRLGGSRSARSSSRLPRS